MFAQGEEKTMITQKNSAFIPTYIDRNTVRGVLSAAALAWAHCLAGRRPDPDPVARRPRTPPLRSHRPLRPAAHGRQRAASQQCLEGRLLGPSEPFARKKWVKKQTDPINDRPHRARPVEFKDAADIKDVDSRAQAGIHQAQSTADSANQTATASQYPGSERFHRGAGRFQPCGPA